MLLGLSGHHGRHGYGRSSGVSRFGGNGRGGNGRGGAPRPPSMRPTARPKLNANRRPKPPGV